MGKPSTSTQISKNPSETSLNITMSKEKTNMPVSIKKSKQLKKKQKLKTQKSIQKVFNRLRSESHENIIDLDESSLNETVVPTNTQDSLIIIDDDVQINNNPCSSTPRKNVYSLPSHSTPIPTIDELILSQSNNIQTINEQCENLTREINADSYLTIDLTADGTVNSTFFNGTVIDLESTNEMEQTSNTSLSGESDVTVINMQRNKCQNRKSNKKIRKFANSIANLNQADKSRLLKLITKEIFNGCNVPTDLRNNLANVRQSVSCATETVEDTYIKQVIVGGKASRNSVGSNIYHPDKNINKTGLRMIVIDGSNVAMEHGHGRVFSVKGLRICIDYFVRRGHVVKAFVPRFRCKFGKSTEPRLLDQLERDGYVVYTPSREIQGKTITPYDDRYIIQCAAEFDGVIVSGDNYRDLVHENPKWKYVIENRLLPFTWVQDMIMFPRDPLGRNGPTLEQFLRHPSP